MIVVADQLSLAASLGIRSDGWQSVRCPPASGAEMNVWRAVGSHTNGWMVSTEPVRAEADCPLLALVEQAPTSQFDALLASLERRLPMPDRAVCLAGTGSNFHGLRGRPWCAESGNLHLTVHLAPNAPARRIGVGFTLLPVVAAVEAMSRLAGNSNAGSEASRAGARTIAGQFSPTAGPRLGIKWVNDIMIEDRKVAGVITHTQSESGRIEQAVLGIGINVAKTPHLEPTPFVPAAGCLADALPGWPVALADVLWELLAVLWRRYGELLDDGPAGLLDDYRRFSNCLGREVCVWPETARDLRTAPPLATGKVLAIESDLALVIAGAGAPIARGRLAYAEVSRSFFC